MNLSRRLVVEKCLTILFVLTAFVFLYRTIHLAQINQYTGGEDSMLNMDVARHIVEGRGFQSGIIDNYFNVQPLPHTEVQRFLGLPYLIAACFKLFGVSQAVPILLNTATVLASAFLLRYAIRLLGVKWFADLAALLYLFSDNYEMFSIMDNNLLVLLTAILLLLGTLNLKEKQSLIWIAFFFGAVTAAGFYLKPTFILSAIPAALFSLFSRQAMSDKASREKWLAFAVFCAASFFLACPYFARNILLFGSPIYHQQLSFRLPLRYGGMNPYGLVRFDQPVTFAEMRRLHGLFKIIEKEILTWMFSLKGVFKLNAVLTVLAPIGFLFCIRRRNWKYYILGFLPMIEPLFSTAVYWHIEQRYLFPLYPCFLFIAGLILNSLSEEKCFQGIGARPYRFRLAAAVFLVGSFVCAYGDNVPRWVGRLGEIEITKPLPSWVDTVIEKVPEDSIIMSDHPWTVCWTTRRNSIITPFGDLADLQKVIEIYKPAYYLHTWLRNRTPTPYITEKDHELIASGMYDGKEWRLYKLDLSKLLPPAEK